MEESVQPNAVRKQRKHSSCSLREKLEVLHRIDSGESASQLALEFSVGRATISDWKKNRHKLERFSNSTSVETLERRHTSKKSPFDKVDEALYIWYMEEIEKGAHISGPVLQEKALQLNGLLQGENNFAASNGWLDRWKKRHGIRLHSLPGGRSADRACKNIVWGDTSDFVSGFLPSAFGTVENGPFDDLSQQESCTPDFKLSSDYLEACAYEHNLTFRAKRKNSLDDSRNADVLRERFKRQFAAAVKRYSGSEPLGSDSGDEKLVEVPEEILHLVKEVPQGCDQEDISEWESANLSENLGSADESPTVAFKSADDVTGEGPVSTIAAARAMEVALRYVQGHAAGTPTDVRFMERWRNIAASSLLSEIRQKKLD